MIRHIIDDITNCSDLELKNCIYTHQDRVRVDKGKIGSIFTTFPEAKPTRNYLCTHTISNSDKKAVGGKGSATFAEMFQNDRKAIINTPGTARDLYSALFGNAPTCAGGIRFFAKYDQIDELFEGTAKKIMYVILWCIEHSVSEFSSKNMMRQFNPLPVEPASLDMAIFEIAYLAECVRTFSEA